MKVYKSSEDTLCIQGKEIKKFKLESESNNKDYLEDSVFNGAYDTLFLGYRFPNMPASKQMFYGSKLAICTLLCSMLENMLIHDLITEDELKQAIKLVIKQVRKKDKQC